MEVITVIEAKQYLRLDADYLDEDDVILSFIKTAQTYCEKYTGLSFTPKTLQMYASTGCAELLYGPVTSITSVNDHEGNAVTYDKVGLQHPKIYANKAFTATYEAGYTTLPDELKTAFKMLTASLYDNRDKESSGIPMGVISLLQPFSRSGGLFL